jgi:hypothetical protein
MIKNIVSKIYLIVKEKWINLEKGSLMMIDELKLICIFNKQIVRYG